MGVFDAFIKGDSSIDLQCVLMISILIPMEVLKL